MKKVIKILILISLVLILFSIASYGAFSVGDITGNGRTYTDIENKGQSIITILSTAGSILSVVVLVILGIKYMLGSVEEKAEYKRTLLPYVIGASFVFAASTIASVIYNIAK